MQVKWSGMDYALATWEDLVALKQQFPRAPVWGQPGFLGWRMTTLQLLTETLLKRKLQALLLGRGVEYDRGGPTRRQPAQSGSVTEKGCVRMCLACEPEG